MSSEEAGEAACEALPRDPQELGAPVEMEIDPEHEPESKDEEKESPAGSDENGAEEEGAPPASARAPRSRSSTEGKSEPASAGRKAKARSPKPPKEAPAEHPELAFWEEALSSLLSSDLALSPGLQSADCDPAVQLFLEQHPPTSWAGLAGFPSEHYPLVAMLSQDSPASLSELTPQLAKRIVAGAEEEQRAEAEAGRAQLEQLLALVVPIASKRKSYGISKASSLELSEDATPGALYVWEAEVLSHLPKALRAEVKSVRRLRTAVSAQIKAVARLVKLLGSRAPAEDKLNEAKEKAEALKEKARQVQELVEQESEKARMLEEASLKKRREKEDLALRKQLESQKLLEEKKQALDEKKQAQDQRKLEAARAKEEKRAQEQAKKEAELKKKEEEQKKKDAQKKTQRGQQAIMLNFFQFAAPPKAVLSDDEESEEAQANPPPASADASSSQGSSSAQGSLLAAGARAEAKAPGKKELPPTRVPGFLDFEPTPHMKLATSERYPRLPEETVEERLFRPAGEGRRAFVGLEPALALEALRTEFCARRQAWAAQRPLRPRPKARSDRARPKLLQFHTEYRPGFFGSGHVRAVPSKVVTGRKPWGLDPLVDYSVDSDDEWGDEPDDGEDLDDAMSDDPDEDDPEPASEQVARRRDGYLQEDDFLVPEDEDGLAEELARSGQIVPRILGPLWTAPETARGHGPDAVVAQLFLPLRALQLMPSHRFADEFAGFLEEVRLADAAPRPAESAPAVPAMVPVMAPPATTSSRRASVVSSAPRSIAESGPSPAKKQRVAPTLIG